MCYDFFKRLFIEIETFSRDFFEKCRFSLKIEHSVLRLVLVCVAFLGVFLYIFALIDDSIKE
ncbi:hypothetical protein SAMN05720489_2404 [Fibrobacter sp. UWB13]|nr:hypothetical protein SAMN05720489_2404 [Fibrobacter sp. UWB13]